MAYHTIKPTNVHHLYNNCKVGNNIEKENRREGTGGYKKVCEYCERMKEAKSKK